MTAPRTVDTEEIARFDERAGDWWNESGSAAPLHALNPTRCGFIRDMATTHFHRDPQALAPLDGLQALDIGCGGGLVAEPLTRLGACVTGIDAAERNIDAARRHARLFGLAIDYRAGAVEDLREPPFDVVLALEVVEHVADREAFLAAAAARVAPGGLLIASTLNRTARAFATAVVGAEYVLGWLARGTHRWSKFVRPGELIGDLAANGLYPVDAVGLSWRPLARRWSVSGDLSINYMVCAARPA